jgi:hypothetical protein
MGSIRYESGQPDHPISPGRIVVEVHDDGRVALAFERFSTRRSWTATQLPALWKLLTTALEHARFPERPQLTSVPPDTIRYAITRRLGDAEERVLLDPNEQYADFSELVMTVVAQMAGMEVLGFELPDGEPRYVEDVREVGSPPA